MKYGYLQRGGYVCPQCVARVRSPGVDEGGIAVDAIIDSGASRTCLPRSLIRALGDLIQGNPVEVRTCNGSKRVRTFFVDIEVEDVTFPRLEIIELPDERKHAMVGRDILNHFKLILDGPREKGGINCRSICHYQ
ncbi:MAG: hypothetical protein F6K16_31590 [Symploca sp. SIO2B6]|nr:hypothetical protein [Symploca sp. SIO2B6]